MGEYIRSIRGVSRSVPSFQFPVLVLSDWKLAWELETI
jgi:hypothetical protein